MCCTRLTMDRVFHILVQQRATILAQVPNLRYLISCPECSHRSRVSARWSTPSRAHALHTSTNPHNRPLVVAESRHPIPPKRAMSQTYSVLISAIPTCYLPFLHLYKFRWTGMDPQRSSSPSFLDQRHGQSYLSSVLCLTFLCL